MAQQTPSSLRKERFKHKLTFILELFKFRNCYRIGNVMTKIFLFEKNKNIHFNAIFRQYSFSQQSERNGSSIKLLAKYFS